MGDLRSICFAPQLIDRNDLKQPITVNSLQFKRIDRIDLTKDGIITSTEDFTDTRCGKKGRDMGCFIVDAYLQLLHAFSLVSFTI